MIYVNYTTDSKKEAKLDDDYMEKSPTELKCKDCFFVGNYKDKNSFLGQKTLCGKYIREVACVEEEGSCAAGRFANDWFNKIDLFSWVKQQILERAGFKFKNR